MDHGAVFVATCLAAAVSTVMMGLYANYPIALAPGMGLNAYLRLHRGARAMKALGSWRSARVFCLRRAVLLDLAVPLRAMADRRDPAESEARRSRPAIGLFLAHDRAGGSSASWWRSGDPGHARRSARARRRCCAAGFVADRRARLPQGHRRHADRHTGRHGHRPAVRACALHGIVVAAALARADLPPARSRRRCEGSFLIVVFSSCWSTCSTTPAR